MDNNQTSSPSDNNYTPIPPTQITTPDTQSNNQASVNNSRAQSGSLIEWPGAFKIFHISKAAMKLNFAAIVYLTIISLGVGIIYNVVLGFLHFIVVKIITFIVYGLLS